MDKKLKIYNIPADESITRIIAISNTPPVAQMEGDKYIDTSANQNRLYKAVDNAGTLSWTLDSWENGMCYMLIEDSVPTFCVYSNNELSIDVDMSFPSQGANKEIYSFTYSSSRMGGAPTLQATLDDRQCLDEEWTDRTCVVFNGTLMFIDKKPSSQYSNESERYKHTIDFVSERVLLERVYFTNIVSYTAYENDPVAIETKFSFFGDIIQVVTRLNESMMFSKLQKNGIGFSVVIDEDSYTSDFIQNIEEPEKLVDISEKTIKETLDMIFEMWGVPYYFDGYDIHIGFSNTPLMSAAGDEFPTFKYGIGNQILLTSKSQSNDIVNRITGRGSSENIPYYYPNETPNGIKAHYMRNGEEIENAVKITVPNKIGTVVPSTVISPQPDGDFVAFEPYAGTYNYDQNTLTYHVPTMTTDANGGIVYSELPLDNIYLSVNENHQTNYNHESSQGVFYKRMYSRLNKHPNTNSLVTTTGITINEEVSGLGLSFLEDGSAYNVYSNSKAGKFEAWIYDLPDHSQESWVFNPQGTKVLNLSYTTTVQNGRTVYNWSDGTTTQPSATSDGIAEKFPIAITRQGYGDVMVFSTTIYVQDDFFTYEPADTNIDEHDLGDNITDTRDMQMKIQKALEYLKRFTHSVVTQEFLDTDRWVWHGGISRPYFLLKDIGLKVSNSVTPLLDDFIYFDSEGSQPTTLTLLPSTFRENGDVWIDAINNMYEKAPNQYYTFENEYVYSDAHEDIRDNDDIKPTIVGVYNDDTPPKRIDRLLDVTFDANDNNEIDSEGKYYHPYFFVKLAKTSVSGGKGFNLFDCASESGNMKIEMKSGYCGGCSFEICVTKSSDGYSVNPIAVFEEDTVINGVTYLAGTPYRDSNGNVKTSDAPYQEEQQDTENNEVWIALLKDKETFAPDTMPYAGFTPVTRDEFVITNINLPNTYIVEAERKLTQYLLTEMENDNPRKYDFNIKLSSIFYKNSKDVLDKWLNEASKLHFIYNMLTLDYYVNSYTYKVNADDALPEVTLTLNEKLKRRRNRFDDFADRIEAGISRDDIGGQFYDPRNSSVTTDVIMKSIDTVSEQLSNIRKTAEKIRMDANGDTIALKTELSNTRELDNQFVDGLFMLGYNKAETAGKAKYYFSGEPNGYFGGKNFVMSFQGEYSSVSLLQKLPNTLCTVTMAMCTRDILDESDDQLLIPIVVNVTFYDSSDTIVETHSHVVDVGYDWEQYTLPAVNKIDNASYFRISFYIEKDENINLYVNGIMVYKGDFTYIDSGGNTRAKSVLPTKYSYGTKEYQKIADGVSNGGNIDKSKSKNGIIVLKAIPLENARYGERYFFSDGISVKTKQYLRYDFNNIEGWNQIGGPYNDSDWVCGRCMEYSALPVIVTIPENFNSNLFVNDSSYRKSICSDASTLCTKDLASPYFEISYGKIVCVKEPIIDFGKMKVFGHLLYHQITRKNEKYYQKKPLRVSRPKSGFGVCVSRKAKTRELNGQRKQYKWKMTSPVNRNLGTEVGTIEIVGIARRKISVNRIKVHIIQAKGLGGITLKKRWIRR